MRMNFNIPLKPAIVLLSILTLAVTSCNTYRKINYLQDVVPDEAERIAINKGILIQPKDMISIVVSSRNPELALMFNLPVISYQAGSESVSGQGSQRLLGYVVDNDGNASFAVKGAKVALLDIDLRKGTLGKALGLKGHGLSLYLSGLFDDLSSITVNMKGTLDVLPVGALPPNPAELLISDRFRKLISELRSEYDYIFLDCPPIDIVADTSIIASAADMTIFIVRAGLMDKRALPMVEEISKSGVYPRMAIALNGIEPKERKYGYGRYGYGYGYGYRYESK